MIESKGGESIKGTSIKDEELIEFGRLVAETLPIWGPANIQCFRVSDGSPRGHRRQPALRRRLPAAARGRRPLPGARPRAGAGRTARAAPGRFPGGRDDDPLLLGPVPVRRSRRYPRTVLRGPARTSRERAGRGLIVRVGVVALAVLAAGCGSRSSIAAAGRRRLRLPPTTRGPSASTSSSPWSTATPGAGCTGPSFASGGWPTGRTAKGNAGFRLRRRAPLVVSRRRARLREARACGCLSSVAAGWSSASTSPRCSGGCTAQAQRGPRPIRRSACGRRSVWPGAAASAR